MLAVKTESLTKYYGQTRGVENVNLQVEKGEIFGFIGPNGAGKSTTIRMLMQLIYPTSGRIEILGQRVQGDTPSIRRRIGYLPSEVNYYNDLTGRQLLSLMAKVYEMPMGRPVDEYADALNLDLSRKVKSYSLGNRKKLAIIQTLMHDPELIILDEPTSGLDPLIQQTFFEMLKEKRDKGATVFFSTHVLPEVEKVCDRVAIIKDGSIVQVSKVSEIPGRDQRYLEVRFKEEGDLIDKYHLRSISPKVSYDGQVHKIPIVGEINDELIAVAQYPILDLVVRQPSLEDLFMEYYHNGNVGSETIRSSRTGKDDDARDAR